MSRQHLSHSEWLTQFHNHLRAERYACGTMKYYVPRVTEFLAFLQKQHIELGAVRPTHVDRYLQLALRRLRHRYGRLPVNWLSGYTNPVGTFLKFVHGQWPPVPQPSTPVEKFQHQIREQYYRWMVEIRGLASSTVLDRLKEANRFLIWLGKRANHAGIAVLSVADVDSYLKYRASSSRRSSLGTIAGWIRLFLRWLHSTGRTNRDLSTVVIGPSLHAFESIPSSLRAQDVEKVLAAAKRAGTASGIRDYAILMLLSKYGMRAGEIVALRLDDIDWRREIIRVRHRKTGTTSYLPLLPEVGNAILKYLKKARPKTTLREVFIRNCAPYRPLRKGGSIYSQIRNWIESAGVVASSRRGPHAFRHARAVSMLRARVSLKEIGDVLGHRSVISTMTYLKLAVEDLRAIALEVPVEVKA